MEPIGIAVGRRSHLEIERCLAAARRSQPNYDHIGSTLTGAPDGMNERVMTRLAPADLSEAAAALHRWATHDGIRASVVPPGPPKVSDTVCVIIPFGPIEMLAPNRVVAMVDEPGRVGLAYGTLPGHPEKGEELFLATAAGPGRVELTITIHARTTGLARAAGPVARYLQHTATRRYLAAWAAAAGG